MKPIYLKTIVCIIFLTSGLDAQVVNVEKARHKTDTTGISGSVALNGSYLKIDEAIWTLNGAIDMQYKSSRNLYLMVMDYKITRSGDQSFQNSRFIHFRHNYEVSNFFRWEAFTQLQDNKVSLLQSRWLIGTGPRVKLIPYNDFRLYVGLIPMYEFDKDTEGVINRDWRFSQYISFSLAIQDRMKLIATSYYQPIFSNWKDYRNFNEIQLSIKILKHLNFLSHYTLSYDRYPPANGPKFMSEFLTGFSVQF